ncbi:MAG: ABC-F family ATP-binding cassette domain-containing protein, partial [Actinomyces sp.]|nr:ABC-F family ATP-binding cassette domain-containing protein [Actinomyces sp.]
MAHLLGTQSLGALAGSRQLLADVDISVEDSSRIGILGPNGAGKSTLLRLVAGLQQPDDGQIITRDGLRIVMLEQGDHLDDDARVMDAVHPGLEEYEWASQPAIRDIHAGLLSDIDLHARVGTLSGGQRRRVDLARVLAMPSDVVCLDEPTNHLDVEGVAWLAQHLNARFARPGASGALIAVTHDRWFLDAVCETIWEVVPGIDPGGSRPQIPGHVEIYDGSYAAYTLARAERLRQADVAAKKRANLLTKELAWLRRGAPARTSKPKFHIAAAEALIADVPPPRDSVELVKMATARLGKDVLDLEDVTVTFPTPEGGQRTILDHVTWRLAPGERVGVVGVNGAGKTTILNLLRGDLEPTSGRVKRGKTVQVATLSQDTHELDDLSDMRVVEAVDQVAHSVIVDGKEVSSSQMTERMGFTRE